MPRKIRSRRKAAPKTRTTQQPLARPIKVPQHLPTLQRRPRQVSQGMLGRVPGKGGNR